MKNAAAFLALCKSTFVQEESLMQKRLAQSFSSLDVVCSLLRLKNFIITITMSIDQEIFRVLMAAGSNGLKLEKIARHVYNSCNSIFTPLNYKDVHAYVTQYLTRCAKDPNSLIDKGKGYGIYHINFKAAQVQQLMLDFSSSATADMNGEASDTEKGKSYSSNDLFGDY